MSHSRSTASVLALAVFALGCADQTMDASRFAGPIDVPLFSHDAGGHHFTAAPLKGEHERPIPNDSKGNGVAQFQLSEDGSALQYKLVVANTENVTQAHIHIGSREAAGPVVVFLYGFNAAGTSENGVLAEGTITTAELNDPRIPVARRVTMEQLVTAMRTDNAYVNVHTFQFPGGEIRNQIEEAGQ
jgi:hypothetical protein